MNQITKNLAIVIFGLGCLDTSVHAATTWTSIFKDKNIEIEDRIEEILSTENITDEDAKLIAKLMIQKGWTDIKKVNFNESSKEFIKKIKDDLTFSNRHPILGLIK